MELVVTDRLVDKCDLCQHALCEYCASLMAVRRIVSEDDKVKASQTGLGIKSAVCVTIGRPSISIRNAKSRYMVAIAIDGKLQTNATKLTEPYRQTFHSHSLLQIDYIVHGRANQTYEVSVTWSCTDAQTVPIKVTLHQTQ